MPRPAFFVAAHFRNVNAIFIGLSKLQRFIRNPTDFVVFGFGNFHKIFWRRGRVNDIGLFGGRFEFLLNLKDNARVLNEPRLLVLLRDKFIAAFGTNISTERDDKPAIGTFLCGRGHVYFWLVGIERPIMNAIRQAVPFVILHVINNDGDFIWIVRVGAERSQRLLNIKR